VKNSKELWKAADIEKNKLFELMEKVQVRISKKSKMQYKPFDLRNCKWKDVMIEVQEMSHRWKSIPGNKATCRKCLEKLGQDSGAFQAWIGLCQLGTMGRGNASLIFGLRFANNKQHLWGSQACSRG
jgi:hypothetical protein